MMLKINRGSRDRIKAEDILKQVLKEEITDPDIFVKAFLHLADLLLYEFKLNEDLEILNELRELVLKVLNIAEKQQLFLRVIVAVLLPRCRFNSATTRGQEGVALFVDFLGALLHQLRITKPAIDEG